MKNILNKNRLQQERAISDNEQMFAATLKLLDKELSKHIIRQHRFHKVRRWRFDFCFLEEKIAIEIDGIRKQHGGDRHSKDPDRVKINEAVCMGWRVLRFSRKQVVDSPDYCVAQIRRLWEAAHPV